MYKFIILLSCTLALFSASVYGQGCSDAGVCSIYHTEPDSDVAVHYFRNGLQYSLGERLAHQFTWSAELGLALTAKNRFTVRMPLSLTTGNLGTYTAPGDLMLLMSHTEQNSKGLRVSFTAGTRLPFSDANGKGLPMPFQPSLGTWDALVAAEGEYKNWAVQVGYQHVLQHYNANDYLPAGQPLDGRGDGYFASRNLIRGNDIMLRTQYSVQNKKWAFVPGAFMVWRLQADQFQNEENQYVIMPDSKGPTFNVVLRSLIPIRDKHSLELMLAGPVMARKQRPDGLTRVLVVGAIWTMQLPGKKFLLG